MSPEESIIERIATAVCGDCDCGSECRALIDDGRIRWVELADRLGITMEGLCSMVEGSKEGTSDER